MFVRSCVVDLFLRGHCKMLGVQQDIDDIHLAFQSLGSSGHFLDTYILDFSFCPAKTNLNLFCCLFTDHYSKFEKGGIISKIRRRLTVQGDSENIDGAAASITQKSAKEPEVTEDVR